MFMTTPPHGVSAADIIQWLLIFLAIVIALTALWVNLDTGKWVKLYRNWKGWKDYD